MMATAAMATAAGAAALLYYTWGRRVRAPALPGEAPLEGFLDQRRIRRNPTRAPSTWFEVIATLSETLRFTYSETLGKWPIVDLAFGINFLMRRQGHLQVASIYGGENSQLLEGPDIILQLKEMLYLLTLCYDFSKKPFILFLEASGYPSDCVLLQEPKAGILKPAFTVIVDNDLQCILLLIRGTHSVKDTLTAVTGAVVPFHHTVLDEGGVGSLVLGYAHYGMVAAARWIAQLATPNLLKALEDYPSYKIKVVGHSLGGGTAALLTYILRERKEFSSTHCVCFAPAACMTWELAESGKPFITSVINGSDLVPTFSAASMDDLRSEVTSSAWMKDFREQMQHVRFLKTVLRSASALGNHLSSIASVSRASLYPGFSIAARARVVNALRPVSSSTQVVMKQAQSVAEAVVRTRPSLTSWSCMGARRRMVSSAGPPLLEGVGGAHPEISTMDRDDSENRITLDSLTVPSQCSNDGAQQGNEEERVSRREKGWVESSAGRVEWKDDLGSGLITCMDDRPIDAQREEDMRDALDRLHEREEKGVHGIAGRAELSEVYLWHQLEEELEQQRGETRVEGEEEVEIAREIIEEEESVAAAAPELSRDGMEPGKEYNRFFPPGHIVHLISHIAEEKKPLEEENSTTPEARPRPRPKPMVGLYLTDRCLYGKLRLSRTMVNDHYMPAYRRVIEKLIKELEHSDHEDDNSDLDKDRSDTDISVS